MRCGAQMRYAIRMRIFFVSLLIFLGLLSGPLLASEHGAFRTQQIEWAGNSQLDNSQVRAMRRLINQYRRELRQLNISKSIFRQQLEESELLRDYLHSQAYYRAEVLQTERDFHYSIRLGPQYRLAPIEFVNLEGLLDPKAASGLSEGQALVADDVLQGLERLRSALDAQTCLWDNQLNYQVRLDHAQHQGWLRIELRDARQVELHSLSLSGLRTVDADWLNGKLQLQPGNCFNRSRLNRDVLSLYNSNLMARVDYELNLEPEGVALDYHLSERKHRTLTFALGASTDLGPYGRLGLEHRNLWGQGQKLSTELALALPEQSLSTQLLLPDVQLYQAQLSIENRIEHLQNDYFALWGFELGFTFTRELSPRIQGSTGANFQQYSLYEPIKLRVNQLRLPNEMRFDSRNNRFHARRGQLQVLRLEPVFDLDSLEPSFIGLGLVSRQFNSTPILPNTIVASRVQLNWVQPWIGQEILAQDRLYSGGSGNLRGFGFQEININGEGGLSQTAASIELRHQFNQWGLNLFWDVAQLREQPLLYGEGEWYQGWGFGLSYFTDFAPIRADLAWPLRNPTDTETRGWQLYLNIGQAF